eukprot:jgi/Tetstr1/444031/TSEL_031970.t1
MNRFLSSSDPKRGHPAVDALFLATFLLAMLFRHAILNKALYYEGMQPSENLADFDDMFNLVRMELEQLEKAPHEATMIVAIIYAKNLQQIHPG